MGVRDFNGLGVSVSPFKTSPPQDVWALQNLARGKAYLRYPMRATRRQPVTVMTRSATNIAPRAPSAARHTHS